MITLSRVSFGDSFTLNRSTPFGTLAGDQVTFSITLTGSTTSNPGVSPSNFFNVSKIALLIAQPGTLDADVPFLSPNYICALWWRLGDPPTPTTQFVPAFENATPFTTFPVTIQGSCPITTATFDWTVFIDNNAASLSPGSSVDFDFGQTMEVTFDAVGRDARLDLVLEGGNVNNE